MTEVVDNNCHCQELIVNSHEGLVCFCLHLLSKDILSLEILSRR